ncbi:hypothetical protein [Haloarcula salina]|uniref:Uncharacterized protein n=1 Tax=Haloarcula salina TaxID=1429914 RepID=A0AA41G7I5_9EURY|nr:hypothetical protein [Haloarcula salina]MBV0901582.1 hypothetical protein [Haloarcula salina]
MAASDALRRRLQRVAPATSGRLTPAEFLLSGAAAGALGWSGTQALARVDPDAGAVLATTLWVFIAGGFVGLTVLHAPESLRFSDVLFVWGAVNGGAMALTVGGLLGLVPAAVAFWHAWVAATAVGYCWSGGVLEGAGQPVRGRGYLGAGVVGLGLLAVGVLAVDRVESTRYLALGALHALPLVLDVRTALPARSRATVVALGVAAALGAGSVV